MAIFRRLNQRDKTMVVVTHEQDMAARAGRIIRFTVRLRDGHARPEEEAFA